MSLSRLEQAKFAQKILPLVERAKDIKELEEIYEIIVLFQSWVKTDDNGVAFDLGEYVFECIQIAKGQEDNGWRSEALKSLQDQLSYYIQQKK